MASFILFPQAAPLASIYDLLDDEEEIEEYESENQIFQYNPTTNQAVLLHDTEEDDEEIEEISQVLGLQPEEEEEMLALAEHVANPGSEEQMIEILNDILNFSHPLAYELPDYMYEEIEANYTPLTPFQTTQEIHLQQYGGDTQLYEAEDSETIDSQATEPYFIR